MKTIAVYNMKGGVGKTTTAVNLAYLAAEEGYRTLICDLDPQASTSFFLRVKAPKKFSAKHLVKGDDKFLKAIKASNYKNLDIMPADFSFRNMSTVLSEKKHSRRRIKDALNLVKSEYDFIFLDPPAALNLETENIFSAANLILLPMIPSVLSVESMEKIITFIEKNGIKLEKLLIFFSLVDKRKKLHKQIMEELKQRESRILHTYIPYSSVVEKMGVTREPLPATSKRSKAAFAYIDLWTDVKVKIGAAPPAAALADEEEGASVKYIS